MRLFSRHHVSAVLFASALTVFLCIAGSGITHKKQAGVAALTPSEADPWKIDQLVEPSQLAKVLSNPQSQKLEIVCVGMPFLYRGAHIPGARLLGPALSPEGLNSLQKWAQSVPKNTEIVLYCGCCPWADCPNIRPAFRILQEMGFTRLRVLHIQNNFKQDWSDRGYPTQKGM